MLVMNEPIAGIYSARRADDARSPPVERLARRLHWKMWHLEPTERTAAEEWADMDEQERDFYRILVRFMLVELQNAHVGRPTTTA
jgi:hypothetical protein